MEGPVAQQMAVTVANLGAKTYTGPITVTVMCFGEAQEPRVRDHDHRQEGEGRVGRDDARDRRAELAVPEVHGGRFAPR